LLVATMLSPLSSALAVNYEKTPAGVTDDSRDPGRSADFMRAIWVPPGTLVTFLGRHDASVTNLRAFFTATSFIKPAVTVDQYLALVGNYYPDGQDLVLMRCRPSPEQVQRVTPILATWPNVFSAIVSDFSGRGFSCPPNLADGDNIMYCAARGYSDSARSVLVAGLSLALDAASSIFADSAASPGAAALKRNYGIYPAFTGLGFSVAGSGTVGSMTAVDTLRESIVPEYLLANTTLEEAGCRCIQVPAYGNKKSADARHTKPVDPNYVWQKGRLREGACRETRRLGAVSAGFDPATAAGESRSAQ